MEITTRANVFGKIATYRFLVDADGTVHVWDVVAGYFTTCHSMTERQMARIRKMVK